MSTAQHSRIRFGLALSLGCALAACGPEDVAPTVHHAPPHIAGLSRYSAAIGTPIEVYGSNFTAWRGEGQRGVLVFNGTFTDSAGNSEPVNAEFDAALIDGGTLRWLNYGPYSNPFNLRQDRVGTFDGTVGIKIVREDGTVVSQDPQPTPITFQVQPSIVIEEFQPTMASCGGRILRALGGAPYRLRVRAVGFNPTGYDFAITVPTQGTQPITLIHHNTAAATDTVGDNGEFTLPQVPAGQQAYGAIVSVIATDAHGQRLGTSFAAGVHNPIGIYYNGNVQIAEIMTPTPVSGCIPGGNEGRTVGYDESMSETRSRRMEVNMNSSWLRDVSTSTGTMTSQSMGTEQNSSNSVAINTTDGRSFSYNYNRGHSEGTNNTIGAMASGTVTVGAEADATIFGFGARANGSVSGTVGVNASHGWNSDDSISVGGAQSQEMSTTRGDTRTVGLSSSEMTTDTTSVTQSVSMNMGGSMGQSFSWEVSSTQSISRSFQGYIPGGGYGAFYRQTMRLIRRGVVVTYNLCGTAQVVGQVDFSDWAWSADLGTTYNGCNPLPPTNLPAAHCNVEPCSGQ